MENKTLRVNIIENATDGILTIDYLGRILSINPSACKLFDYEPKDLIGKNIEMLMPAVNTEQHQACIQRYKVTGQPNIDGMRIGILGVRKDGSKFPFRLGLNGGTFSGRRIYTAIIYVPID